jgi:hypothetical protein
MLLDDIDCLSSNLDNRLPYYDKFVRPLILKAFTGSAWGEPFDPEHGAEGLRRVEHTKLDFPEGIRSRLLAI